MKSCSACRQECSPQDFYRDKSKKDGLSSTCKTCSNKRSSAWSIENAEQRSEHRKKWVASNPEQDRASKRSWANRNKHKVSALTRQRQASQLKRTPSWYDNQAVEVLYAKARVYGFHVDHIVPLQSDAVCGLHVFENLQLLHPSENCSKQNKYWPDMWHEV